MLRKYGWSFKVDDEIITGEAETIEEAHMVMEMRGFIKDKMPSSITERSEEEIALAARNLPGPAKVTSSLLNLSRANETLFKQVDALKNQVAEFEMKLSAALFDRRMYMVAAEDSITVIRNVRELAIAWNTEQHARKGDAHVEPAFVTILREWQYPKSLEKRKAKDVQEIADPKIGQ